jgi:hypothetical protein
MWWMRRYPCEPGRVFFIVIKRIICGKIKDNIFYEFDSEDA